MENHVPSWKTDPKAIIGPGHDKTSKAADRHKRHDRGSCPRGRRRGEQASVHFQWVSFPFKQQSCCLVGGRGEGEPRDKTVLSNEATPIGNELKLALPSSSPAHTEETSEPTVCPQPESN